MARFDSAIALAKRLILKNGETATLRRPVDGTLADATKPWEGTAGTPHDAKVAMVFLGEESARSFGLMLKSGEQMVLIAADDLATTGPSSVRFNPDPSTDIILRADGERWSLVKRKPLKPNGQYILEILVVKK